MSGKRGKGENSSVRGTRRKKKEVRKGEKKIKKGKGKENRRVFQFSRAFWRSECRSSRIKVVSRDESFV